MTYFGMIFPSLFLNRYTLRQLCGLLNADDYTFCDFRTDGFHGCDCSLTYASPHTNVLSVLDAHDGCVRDGYVRNGCVRNGSVGDRTRHFSFPSRMNFALRR